MKTNIIEELKKESHSAYSYVLMKNIKKLNPDRLQWCEHPLAPLFETAIESKNTNSVEIVECDFNDKNLSFSIFVSPNLCQIKRIKKNGINKPKIGYRAMVGRTSDLFPYIVKLIKKEVIKGELI